jgi:hypothetical protein
MMQPDEPSAYTQAVISVILSRITHNNKENCIIHSGYLVLALLTAFAGGISELVNPAERKSSAVVPLGVQSSE